MAPSAAPPGPAHLSGAAAWGLLADVDSLKATHKLRLRVPHTALFSGGELTAVLSSRSGAVARASGSELSVAALRERLLSRAPLAGEAAGNPHAAVAVAHLSSGLSFLVSAADLVQLLPGERVAPELRMLQAFIPPAGDARFLTTAGGADGPVTTSTQARSFSARYAPAASRAAAADEARAALQRAVAGVRSASPGGAQERGAADSGGGALAGLQPPPARQERQEPAAEGELGSGGSGRDDGDGVSGSSVTAAPARVAAAAATAVQALMSHLDKARGVRVQGLVAEFVLRQGDDEGHLVLTGLPQVVLDPQRSLSGATFTDAWAAHMAGAGPPPAPAPAQHSSYAHAAPARPASAPRGAVARSPSPAVGGLPASQQLRPASASPARVRASRPGAGGNPSLHAHCSSGSDACRLWLVQPRRPADSLTAQLAAQLDAAEARIQALAASADAARLTAAAALAQAGKQVAAVATELQELRADAAAAGHERRQLLASLAGLHEQRAEQDAAAQRTQAQVAALQAELAQDRATLATSVRQHQQKEQQLQEELAASTDDACQLRAAVGALTSRLEEEGEVVAALRAQLVDFKLQLGSLQLAAKKGRQLNASASTNALRRGSGLPGPLGSWSAAGDGSAGLAAGSSRRETQTQPSSGSRRATTTTWCSAGQLRAAPAPAAPGPGVCQAGGGLQQASQQPCAPAVAPAGAGATGSSSSAAAAPAAASGQRPQTALASKVAAGSSPSHQPAPAAAPGSSCSGGSSEPSPAPGGGRAAAASQPPPRGPDALVADMVAGIAAQLGASLGPPATEAPPLEIGDLLLGDRCSVLPDAGAEAGAKSQLALIAGLMRQVAGDVAEVYAYYALLGRAGQVAGDSLVLELEQLGRLAYDCHVAQDPRSLAAVEDALAALADRRADNDAAGTPLAGDVLLPSEFPELLVRLACVRYRWGPVAFQFDWDGDGDDDLAAAVGDGSSLSPRSQRMRQQLQQQAGGATQGPRVLRPEGGRLPGRPRSASPSRPGGDEYSPPTASDSLVEVTRAFLQHEVLRHARRCKLAGSALGHRRAAAKPAALQGWATLPPGSGLWG